MMLFTTGLVLELLLLDTKASPLLHVAHAPLPSSHSSGVVQHVVQTWRYVSCLGISLRLPAQCTGVCMHATYDESLSLTCGLGQARQ
eukprot:6901206-Prymnesium_polylepis.2